MYVERLKFDIFCFTPRAARADFEIRDKVSYTLRSRPALNNSES